MHLPGFLPLKMLQNSVEVKQNCVSTVMIATWKQDTNGMQPVQKCVIR